MGWHINMERSRWGRSPGHPCRACLSSAQALDYYVWGQLSNVAENRSVRNGNMSHSKPKLAFDAPGDVLWTAVATSQKSNGVAQHNHSGAPRTTRCLPAVNLNTPERVVLRLQKHLSLAETGAYPLLPHVNPPFKVVQMVAESDTKGYCCSLESHEQEIRWDGIPLGEFIRQ
ncbi:hypothetical protein VUR80DRAFT_7473 [Thermomyces stellatus]